MNIGYIQTVTEQLTTIVQRSTQLMTSYATDAEYRGDPFGDPLGLRSTYAHGLWGMMGNLTGVYNQQVKLMSQYMQLHSYTVECLMGLTPESVAEQKKDDRRFRADDWNNVLYFDLLRQAYLIAAEHVMDCVEELGNEDDQPAKKLLFHTQQLVDALAPNNYAMTNPEVITEFMNTGGLNLLRGYSALLKDLQRGRGNLSINMTDSAPFIMGRNIAATAGKVVFQNEMLQLLQYEPRTDAVYRRPLLIVPPWINKYYILDLRNENSFIRWAVDQGYTVFVISWVNPDESYANKSFEDYLVDGVVAALDAVEKATGESSINTIGYCLGGTLLACTNGYLSAKGDDRIASSTYFTTLVDFAEVGDLGIFIDEEQLASLETQMKKKGYLDGSNMAMTFSMLRANDLVWPFYINNYLMGKEPAAFDLLHWNADNTRMPAEMHSFYLRNMYQNNLLSKPGGITLAETPIDLTQVKTPSYFVSGKDDHIAPWESTFTGAKLFSGPVRFILGESGHIAGIINPPRFKKYGYWTGLAPKGRAETWLKNAVHHPGSWWDDWQRWIKKHNSEMVVSRNPGGGQLPAIEDAPGSYVQVRLNG